MFKKVKSSILIAFLILFHSSSVMAQTAPNFSVVDSDGISHNLYNEYLDQGKTVVVKIFFVNCPPCFSIAPSFQQLYEDWGEGMADVEFFEMSNKANDSNADVAGWKNQLGLSFPSVGEDGDALEALAPYLSGSFGPYFGTPTFFIIAPDGTVTWDVRGSGTSGTIAALDQAISNTGAQKPGGEVLLPTSFNFIIGDAFGENIENINLTLGSSTSSIEFPLNPVNGLLEITDISEEFPGINDPVIRISKQDELKNKLSAIDILIIVRHILGLVDIENPSLLLAADTNGDGSINAIDLITLQRVILGLINAFPASDPYIFVPSELPVMLTPGESQIIEFEGIKLGDLNGF